MEPESTRLCKDCSELTCIPSTPLTENSRTIPAYRASSEFCACCDFLLRHFERVGSNALRRFTQFEKSALEHWPARLSTKRHEIFPSGLHTVHVEAGLHLPNHFIYTFDFMISSCKFLSECASTASWRTFPTSVDEKLLQIRKLLGECDKNHPLCHQSSHLALPKRLIELDNTKTESARLVYTQDLDTTALKYTSLSYCWGDWQPVRTLRKNVDAFHSAISCNNLPQTLKDAMSFTKELGIRYIWIDALCIVQDDPFDWETEADKMYGIYAGSYLTLLAREAHSSAGGCFAEKPISTSSTRSPTHRGFFATVDAASNTEAHIHIVSQNDVNERQSALGRRGWCCQEQQLPRRRVEVLGSELLWHCVTESRWETGYRREFDSLRRQLALDSLGAKSDQNTPPSNDMKQNRLWWKCLEDYSQRRFTISRDRLAALAGLVHMYQRLTGDEPCLGLWRNTLREDLSWMRYDTINDRELDPPLPTPVPSWCPLSCNQTVKFNWWSTTETTAHAPEFCLEVLHCDVDWVGKPFVSDLRDSVLIVSGPVRELYLSEATEINDCNPPYFNVDHEVLDFEKSQLPWRCAVQWDREEYRLPQKWLCLLLSRRPPTGYALGGETFLVLDPVKSASSDRCYRRVGIGSLGRERAKAIECPYEWKFDVTDRATMRLL